MLCEAQQPGRSPGPPEPYRPRRFECLGVWRIGSFELKAYAITWRVESVASILPIHIVEAARRYAALIESEANTEGGHFDLGFVVLHEGRDRVYLLMDWWAHENVLCQALSKAEFDSPASFERVRRPLVACVWEQLVIAHERDAWVRHMLQERPDRAAYLADRMPSGLY
jgi:hypothetical protein